MMSQNIISVLARAQDREEKKQEGQDVILRNGLR